MPTAEFETFSRLLAGQYALEREIGRGGMGVVYLGRDLKLDRPVAIKTLPPNLADDATIRERFLREARTAAALSHPNIVPIYRADEIDGRVFFVMGYVDGESLAEHVVAGGPVDPRVVVRVMRDVAWALDFAHARGVVHRDVKAENILIDRHTGAALVTDFGIARLAEAKPLTATGQVLGTVYYMSPEQVSGEPLDGRSDLYSLGVAAFYALAGRFPFDGGIASAVLVAHVTKTPPPLLVLAPTVPRALADIVDRCLAKDPDARFQTGGELADALTRAEADVARDASRPSIADSAPRLVSDTEAQAIWSRAAALQAQTGVVPRPIAVAMPRDASDDARRTSGYDVNDVRGAAIEAGIAEQYVQHAMAEHGLVAAVAAPGDVNIKATQARAPVLAGAPTTIDFEAVVAGEIPERDYDLVLEMIRHRLGEAGVVSAVGRSFAWNSMNRRRSVHVSVLARNGKTTVRITENLGQLAGGLFGGILGGGGGGFIGAAMGLGIGLFHSPVAAAAIEVGWLAAMYGLARTIFVSQSRKRTKQLRQLAEEIVSQIQESIGDTPGAPRLRPPPNSFLPR